MIITMMRMVFKGNMVEPQVGVLSQIYEFIIILIEGDAKIQNLF